MRDLLLTIIVFASLPLIIARPYIGILMWSWLGYMNPHRMTWGFAYDWPFSQAVAIATLIGVVFYNDRRKLPISGLTVVWLSFVFWVSISTAFALVPVDAFDEWTRTIKIQLFALLTILLMQREQLVKWLVWVIVFSLGFFGVKGGIFSITTGGNYLVWGPAGSFIEDNNSLALALIMTLPLMRFCQMRTSNRFANWALIAAMCLTALSVLVSHSRGAMLGATAMTAFLWWKGGNKIGTGIFLLLAVPLILVFMPDEWWTRMSSIGEYQQDASAMGRINAWWFSFHLALDRPLVGGGFQTFTPELFTKYAPNPLDFHDAHSIYFETLAEQGFVGLFLFLSIGVLTFRTAGKLYSQTLQYERTRWIGQLAAMIQVSLVGYAATGAFLGLAYFDLYYQLVAIVVILRVLATSEMRAKRNIDDLNIRNPSSVRTELDGYIESNRPE